MFRGKFLSSMDNIDAVLAVRAQVPEFSGVARESQERAGEAQLARRAQRVPVFDYGVAVLAVHETPPHRLNWLFADMPSASYGGFRFYLVFQFIPRTAAVR